MALWFVRIYGWVALTGMFLWCGAGAGIYGSPLAAFEGVDRIKLMAILVAGPISAFLAGLLAARLPKTSIAWLLSGAIISATVLLVGFPNADYPMLSAMLVSAPMLLGACCLFPKNRATVQ